MTPEEEKTLIETAADIQLLTDQINELEGKRYLLTRTTAMNLAASICPIPADAFYMTLTPQTLYRDGDGQIGHRLEVSYDEQGSYPNNAVPAEKQRELNEVFTKYLYHTINFMLPESEEWMEISLDSNIPEPHDNEE